jgi:hypothetical protein
MTKSWEAAVPLDASRGGNQAVHVEGRGIRVEVRHQRVGVGPPSAMSDLKITAVKVMRQHTNKVQNMYFSWYWGGGMLRIWIRTTSAGPYGAPTALDQDGTDTQTY